MSKKTIYLLCILISMVLLCLPLINGFLLKIKYFDLIDNINHDGRFKIEVLSYQQGWFNSYGKLRITLLRTSLANLNTNYTSQIDNIFPLHFIIDEHIIHGPVIYTQAKHKLGLGYADIKSLLYFDQNASITQPNHIVMDIETLATFDNHWRGYLSIPHLSFSIDPVGQINWNGLDGVFVIKLVEDGIKHIRVNLTIGSISITRSIPNSLFTDITTQPIKYRYTATNKAGMWSGNTTIYTKGITITKPDKTTYNVRSFVINTAFGIGSQTIYNTNVVMNMKNLQLSDQVLPLFSPLYIKFSASNFNTQSINAFIDTFTTSQRPNILATNRSIPIEKILANSITPNSTINGEALSNTSMGEISCQAKTSWKPNTPPPNNFADVITGSYTEIFIKASPPIMAKIVEQFDRKVLNSEITKAKAAQSQTNNSPQITSTAPKLPLPASLELTNDLAMLGYISRDADEYVTTLTIDGGVLKINGKAIPFALDNASSTEKNIDTTPTS